MQLAFGKARPHTATGSGARGATRPVVSATSCRGAQHSAHNVRTRAVSLDTIPLEALVVGGAVLVSTVGLLAYQASTGQLGSTMPGDEQAPAAEAAAEELLPRQDAVLVFGGTGKMGRQIVQQLVRSGRTVIAAVRSADKASEVFAAAGLREGYQSDSRDPSGGILVLAPDVDVTRPETLTAQLFEGVTQVVSCLGSVAGRQPDGSFGYIDGMSPERVDAQGTTAIAAAMQQHMAKQELSSSLVLPMGASSDIARWQRLDDVIMGGQSSSGLTALDDGSGARWKGDLIVEGGGFCGARTVKLAPFDMSEYDGIKLRVKGDGQTFKLNIKTTDQEDTPESTYQATFDTSPDGDFTTVYIPWHNFVSVKRAQSNPEGAPLDPATISQFGLVLSRFEFNKMPNPNYKPGPFELVISGGISAFSVPRPQLLLVSSAGVERNAIIGDNAEARKRDIPIVQLNPGGVLNHKYEGEAAVRSSGFPYTVVRCTGLDDDAAAEPRLLEVDQGDAISGKISRTEAAAVVVAALSSPDAAFKTFEVRRGEASDAKGKAMGPRQYNRLFLKLAQDKHRWRVGLQPFPRVVPPPAPVTEERKQEILADPRVQEAQAKAQARQQREQGQQQQQNGSSGNGAAGNGAGEKVAVKERETVGAKA